MDFQKEYQCGACDNYFSHPIDQCPFCSDQFYWLVLYSESPDAAARETFTATMNRVAEGQCPEKFMTYGNRLWLPHNFWSKDLHGESLLAFPWVVDIKLYQHEKSAATAANSEPARFAAVGGLPPNNKPSTYETSPALAKAIVEGDTARVGGIGPLLKEVGSAHHEERNSPNKNDPPEQEHAPGWLTGLFHDHFIAVMIFLFFVMLSLTYMVMRYHKNTTLPNLPTTSEVRNDRTVLP